MYNLMLLLPQRPYKLASKKAEPMKVTVIKSGVMPNILIKPGALEKLIVLKSSP